MSRENTSPQTRGRFDSRHSAPFAKDDLSLWARLEQPMELSGTWYLRRTGDANLKRQQAESVVGVPTMVLSETRGLQLFWVVRGGIGWPMRLIQAYPARWILSLEPERFKNRLAIAGFSPAWLHWFLRSSCLCFQFSCVEAFSFLPNDQGNCRDLARQSQARHLRLDAAVNPLLIKILQRSSENPSIKSEGLVKDKLSLAM